jgi:hypothetical protein
MTEECSVSEIPVYHPEPAARRLIAWVIAFTDLNHHDTVVALLLADRV